MSTTYPQDFLYTEEHEWLSIDGDVATLGITHYAQHELGDVVFVELPDVGTEVDAGDPIGNIDSSKTSAEVFSPVSGQIVEVNEDLDGSPELVNEEPHGNGWIAKVKLRSKDELEGLMDAGAYTDFAQTAG